MTIGLPVKPVTPPSPDWPSLPRGYNAKKWHFWQETREWYPAKLIDGSWVFNIGRNYEKRHIWYLLTYRDLRKQTNWFIASVAGLAIESVMTGGQWFKGDPNIGWLFTAAAIALCAYTGIFWVFDYGIYAKARDELGPPPVPLPPRRDLDDQDLFTVGGKLDPLDIDRVLGERARSRPDPANPPPLTQQPLPTRKLDL